MKISDAEPQSFVQIDEIVYHVITHYEASDTIAPYVLCIPYCIRHNRIWVMASALNYHSGVRFKPDTQCRPVNVTMKIFVEGK